MTLAMAKWPQALKDQYNEEIRKRKTMELLRIKADEIKHISWGSLSLTEESVFSMLAHFFPLNHLVIRILKQCVSETDGKTILLSWKQIHFLDRTFPGYFSDKEKIIVLLNHYRFYNDTGKICDLISHSSHEKEHRYWKLIFGFIFLDLYLSNLNSTTMLDKAIDQLSKVQPLLIMKESRSVVSAVLAFCYYMQSEFKKSEQCLNIQEPEDLHIRFKALVKSVA